MGRSRRPDTPERAAARKALVAWAKRAAKVGADRDEVIKAAVAAGVATRTIQEITGVARTTISRVAPSHRYSRS